MLLRHYDLNYTGFHPTAESLDSSHTMAGYGNIYDKEPAIPPMKPTHPVGPEIKNNTSPVVPASNTTNTTVPVVPIVPASNKTKITIDSCGNPDATGSGSTLKIAFYKI